MLEGNFEQFAQELYPTSSIVGEVKDRRTIQEAFEEFHRLHPDVYATIVATARSVKARGYKKYSCHAIMERVRWHYKFERQPQGDFKINDHHGSRYARLIMDSEPDLVGFFELRPLRAV